MHDGHLHIEHLTRVEGHGNITLDVKNGKIKELRLDIVEAPRFFEAMLLGRSIIDAPVLTSRICGICSCGHTLASITASEDALGVKVTDGIRLMRKLVMHGEILTSHILHIYFLAAPDFVGVPSVLPLIKSHPDVVMRAIRLKKISNDLCDLIVGRHTHPITMKIGGFTFSPKKEELLKLCDRIEKEAIPDIWETVKLIKSLATNVPVFERDTEYIALSDNDEYAFIDGDIVSSDGDVTKQKNYLDKIKEFIVDHSSAKHTKANRNSYMVGALSRLNINHKQLHSQAKKAIKEIGLKVPCKNPYMITIAQLIESVHCLYDALDIIKKIVKIGFGEEKVTVKVKEGRGVGAVEVPRGTLYHEYVTDSNGVITHANCIIPTGQNLANIEADMHQLVPQILDKPKEEIALALEMLVRAYDPCISCSTHLLDVKFV